MEILLMGLGLVLIFEGLVVALLPKRLDDILKMLNDMPIETRRTFGLGAMALGLVILWLTKG